MKINLRDIPYFILGCLILIPVNFEVFDTQFFFVQMSLMVMTAAYLVFANRKARVSLKQKISKLEMIVLLYMGWVILSFVLNLLFSFDTFEIQGRRLFSITITMLLLLGFFVGRALIDVENRTDQIVKGISFTYLVVIFYFIFIFFTQSNLDLFLIREAIGQRLPFVISFAVILVAAYFFLGKRKSAYNFVIVASGILVVLLSLTRAAYIQIAISFMIIFFNEIKKYFWRGLLVVSLFVAVGFIVPRIFGNSFAFQQVNNRVEQVFDIKQQSEEDASGSFRLQIWRFLANKLIDDPVRLVIGYGQLGPTQITKGFVLPDGSSGTSSAHNQYLDIVIREGLVGLLLFLWLCSHALTLGFSKSSVDDRQGIFVLANSIGLVGVMFYSFFHETFRYPMFGSYFWLYLGILSKITKRSQ